MYQLLACNVAVLAIATIYYAWKEARGFALRRQAKLNERVAYMLWSAAQRGG